MDDKYRRAIEDLIEKLAGTDINSDGDLIIRLYTVKDVGTSTFKSATNGESIPGNILMSVKVTRKVMIDNFEYFRRMFTRQRWLEHDKTVIDMECDHPLAATLWFHAHHEDEVPETFNEMPVEEVWEVIEFGLFLQSKRPKEANFSKLRKWLVKVVDHHSVKNAKHAKENEEKIRMLLYPCYLFDLPASFATLTRLLVYNFAGHITEYNPTENYHLHLDGNMIGALNGARGSLKSQLVGGFFEPEEKFFEISCKCKEKSLYAYAAAVHNTELWPIQRLQQKSIVDITDCAGSVNFAPRIPEDACMSCRYILNRGVISDLLDKIASKFQGICLDCVKKTKTGDIDKDYWRHDRLRKWSSKCRISHGQSTWYWSFMGKRDLMHTYQEARKEERNMRETE